MDVMAPGGLAPGGKGIRSIQRVRLMHAAVRRLLLTDGTWDTAAWGVPINQEDLAGTMLSFSYVPCEPLRRLGVDVSDQDAEDYIACWNVVGEMLGVLPEMRPAGVAEATELVGLIRARHDRPSPEGAAMTAALVDLLEQMTPHLGHRRSGPAHIRGLGRLVPVMIRHLIGDDVAEMISVPPARPGWFRILEPLLVLIRAVESGVERDRHLHTVVEPLGRALLEGSFAIDARWRASAVRHPRPPGPPLGAVVVNHMTVLAQQTYTDWETFWYVGGFLAWAPAYVAVVLIAFRERRLEIPMLAATSNVVWEFMWGFVFDQDMGPGLQFIYRAPASSTCSSW